LQLAITQARSSISAVPPKSWASLSKSSRIELSRSMARKPSPIIQGLNHLPSQKNDKLRLARRELYIKNVISHLTLDHG